MQNSYQTLRVSRDGSVATITIDNGPINLMTIEMLNDLDRAGRELSDDSSINVVVLQSANPDFFIAHADLDAIVQLPESPAPREEKLGMVHAALDRFRTMPKVTIAKIAGRCRGGGSELALACDMRFGAIGKAVLSQPEVGVGIIPGAGGSVRLPKLIGRGRALEVILGAGDFSAEVAERYGYLNRALPPHELDSFVDTLAKRIAGFPLESIALAKEAVSWQSGTIEDQLAMEEVLFLKSVHLPRSKARMAAALQAGMQTPVMERCSFNQIWAPLAGV